VIDSTFKTNQWNKPLYARMYPNVRGLEMPIFLMLCSADNETGQEQTALYLTMKAVFLNMGNIRPNTIVIDKSQTKFIAITQAVRKDAWCWENQDVGGIQVRCHLLLCWFHAKKAWVEHLLLKLPEVEQGDLYKAMCSMLDSITKEQFDAMYRRFKVTYANNNRVLKYVEKGWTRSNSQWRRMWPRWSKMFRHGHVNTTNLMECMWHYVKYTLLDGNVNRRLDELTLAIIGNPETRCRFGGNTLVEHYNDAHFLSMSGKYSKRGGIKVARRNCKKHGGWFNGTNKIGHQIWKS
jgi:hypothetical protein